MRSIAAAAAALLLASCAQKDAGKLTCPQPETGAFAGSVPESAGQLATAQQRLGGGDENEIAELTRALRTAHPHASNGAIVNYMVTAYCPVINRRADLDAAAKAKALDAFATRADRIVTSPR